MSAAQQAAAHKLGQAREVSAQYKAQANQHYDNREWSKAEDLYHQAIKVLQEAGDESEWRSGTACGCCWRDACSCRMAAEWPGASSAGILPSCQVHVESCCSH